VWGSLVQRSGTSTPEPAGNGYWRFGETWTALSRDRNRPPKSTRNRTVYAFEQFVPEFPTRLLVLLLFNVVMNSTDFSTVVCDVLEGLSSSRQWRWRSPRSDIWVWCRVVWQKITGIVAEPFSSMLRAEEWTRSRLLWNVGVCTDYVWSYFSRQRNILIEILRIRTVVSRWQ